MEDSAHLFLHGNIPRICPRLLEAANQGCDSKISLRYLFLASDTSEQKNWQDAKKDATISDEFHNQWNEMKTKLLFTEKLLPVPTVS